MDQRRVVSEPDYQPGQDAETATAGLRKNPDEPYYSAEQIEIPPQLPEILKSYTKAAVKTQPLDLLRWSAAYFRSQAQHEPPPVKDRIEAPADAGDADAPPKVLSVGILKVLHRQLSHQDRWGLNEIQQHWSYMGLPMQRFAEIVKVGGFRSTSAEWLKFLLLACGEIEDSLPSTLAAFAQVITREPDGSNARIPFETLAESYTYLARHFEGVPQSHIDKVLAYLKRRADTSGGMVHPGDWLLDVDCPSLSPNDKPADGGAP